MDPKLAETLKLLWVYTGGTLNLYSLAGPQRGKHRKHIMETLTGAKATVAKSGYNAVREALFAATGVTGCIAAQEEALREFARQNTDPAFFVGSGPRFGPT